MSNVHLVPAARDHDTFHQIKNRSVKQTLSVKISHYLNNVFFISNTSFAQKLIFGANTNLTAMRCSVTSHFGVNFRDKFLPVCLIFNVKLL